MRKGIGKAILYGASFLAGADGLSGQSPKKQETVQTRKETLPRKPEIKVNAKIAEILADIKQMEKDKLDPAYLKEKKFTQRIVQMLIDGQYNDIAKIILKLFEGRSKTEYKQIAAENGVTLSLVDSCMNAQNNDEALGQDAKVRSDLARLQLALFFEGGPKPPPRIP